MSRPVILFIDQFSELGGAQRVLLDLLPALTDSYTLVFLLPGPGPFPRELERRGIRWEPIAVGNYTPGRKAAGEAVRFAIRQPAMVSRITKMAAGAALIYANGPRLFPATALAARHARVPLLWHLHLQVEFARDRRLIQAAARIGRPAVIACSQACLEPFPKSSVLRKNAEVIYNGVANYRGATVRERVPVPGPVIGIVARIHPDKGQADVLRAAPEILRAFPGARFRFVGPVQDAGYLRELQTHASKLDCVEFCGPVPSPNEWAPGLDLLLVPSHREPLGLIILEAFSAGIPVVAAATGGTPEIIQTGRNGLLFPRGDTAQLAHAVIRMCQDIALREAIIHRAREDYQQRWTVERFRSEMRARIDQQIARRPQDRSTRAR